MKPVLYVIAFTLIAWIVSNQPWKKDAPEADTDAWTVCHAEADGTYTAMTMRHRAVPDHMAHGDGLVDEGFDSNCQPKVCMCWTADELVGELVGSPHPGLYLADAYWVWIDVERGTCALGPLNEAPSPYLKQSGLTRGTAVACRNVAEAAYQGRSEASGR